jgi:hypothetical protein
MNRLARSTLVLVVLARIARADDTAALAYRQAEELAKQGKWIEACPLYEASYRADPQIGVLLHLADCHEHAGRFASAWAEFNDAVELAHRRSDNREALARSRADAVKPKVAYLHVAPPPAPVPPGFAVQRDGLDITVLVGTDLPIDPGEHEIIATAPGFVEVRKKITIGAQATTSSLVLPALQKQPDKPVVVEPPKLHEGSLEIKSQRDAHISLDSAEIGVGGYKGKVKSGGHQLRVTAPGMRPYQSEIFVADDETRTIDVPLEKEPTTQAVVYVPTASREDLPRYEVGASFAPGTKLRADDPAVLAYRLDFGLRLGASRRVNLGLYTEYGSVQASGSCGTDIPGPMPSSPYDYGAHNQFKKCMYVATGLQLYVHIAPRRRLDPYLGLAPNFRFGSVEYVPHDLSGTPQNSQSNFMPGIFVGTRAGADYHPTPSFPEWAVGGFLQLDIAVVAQEQSDHVNNNHASSGFLQLFGGLRSSLVF